VLNLLLLAIGSVFSIQLHPNGELACCEWKMTGHLYGEPPGMTTFYDLHNQLKCLWPVVTEVNLISRPAVLSAMH